MPFEISCSEGRLPVIVDLDLNRSFSFLWQNDKLSGFKVRFETAISLLFISIHSNELGDFSREIKKVDRWIKTVRDGGGDGGEGKWEGGETRVFLIF